MFFSSSKNTVLFAIGGCSVEQGLFFAPGTVGIRLRPAWLRRDKVYR